MASSTTITLVPTAGSTRSTLVAPVIILGRGDENQQCPTSSLYERTQLCRAIPVPGAASSSPRSRYSPVPCNSQMRVLPASGPALSALCTMTGLGRLWGKTPTHTVFHRDWLNRPSASLSLSHAWEHRGHSARERSIPGCARPPPPDEGQHSEIQSTRIAQHRDVLPINLTKKLSTWSGLQNVLLIVENLKPLAFNVIQLPHIAKQCTHRNHDGSLSSDLVSGKYAGPVFITPPVSATQ